MRVLRRSGFSWPRGKGILKSNQKCDARKKNLLFFQNPRQNLADKNIYDGESEVDRQSPPHKKRLAFCPALRSNLLFNLQEITYVI
jgi:hypothetical protein